MFSNKTDQRVAVLAEQTYLAFLDKVDAREMSDMDLQAVNGTWGGWGWGGGWGSGAYGGYGWGGWGWGWGWGSGWGGWGWGWGSGWGWGWGHRRWRR
ncbi:hypothetical protein KDH_20210 [Dictyobacter sp. S3.2.2.5]|uniref:Uncharacterized protein n=1 Tax=Dictyobacter halimunensis TaxID=3026934 RepID=A0ABQ6FRX0_9CHLR|nr:hypothetical protein KDH_20210 [Dictyobacter sp. S3.2.2.5]